MLTGTTQSIQEGNKVAVVNKIKLVTTLFLIAVVLPFVIYSLFYFRIITGKSAFNAEVQEPVAKIVTPTGVGTAFLISPTLLLTARHVVENCKLGDEVDVFFEQSKTKLHTRGRIKYTVTTTYQSFNNQVPMDYFLSDVAVLEVSEITDIEPLVMGESDAVSNLDEVILIGYPNGDYSITKGNINSLKFQGFDLFKLDAASNPGNSGGPCILKSDNSVIGILVGGSGPQYQGENVALKIDDVKRYLKNIK